MRKIRVVVADDHPLIVDAVTAKLSAAPEIEIVGAASTFDGILETCGRGADVVVCGLHVPAVGFAWLRTLVRKLPALRVILLTTDDSAASVLAAFDAGAAGYVTKAITGDELARHVRIVAAGGLAVDASIGGVLAATVGPADAARLSRQELEVLRLVSLGSSNPQIAAELHVAISTVKTYLARVFVKLDVADRSAAVAVGKDLGLI